MHKCESLFSDPSACLLLAPARNLITHLRVHNKWCKLGSISLLEGVEKASGGEGIIVKSDQYWRSTVVLML